MPAPHNQSLPVFLLQKLTAHSAGAGCPVPSPLPSLRGVCTRFGWVVSVSSSVWTASFAWRRHFF